MYGIKFHDELDVAPVPQHALDRRRHGYSLARRLDHARGLVDQDRVVVVVEVADALRGGGLVARGRRAVAHGVAASKVSASQLSACARRGGRRCALHTCF